MAVHDRQFLLTDKANSLMSSISNGLVVDSAYTAYGYMPESSCFRSFIGFNGQIREPLYDGYALGNGVRLYLPVLMRFASPDSTSPFGEGGPNSYAYCLGDPVNRVDPSGQTSIFQGVKSLFYKKLSKFRIRRASPVGNHLSGAMAAEYSSLQKGLSESVLDITVVHSSADMKRLNASGFQHKYVIADDNTFVVGSMKRPAEFSHAAIAKYASEKLDASAKIVSAGGLKMGIKGVEVDNFTGHYLMPRDRIALAKFRIRGLGMRARNGINVQ